MKTLPALILALILSAPPLPTAALELSKGLPHYAREMEFYYLNPRPEIIPGLIENFNKNKVLASAENRLMLAAFLAELTRAGRLDLEGLINQNGGADKNIRHTLAWAVHLSGLANENQFLSAALGQDEAALLAQIKRTPRRLSDWPRNSEKSVLQMRWAAFMAGGNPAYVDAIVQSALELARASSPYNRGDRAAGAAAAASLYDLTKTHKKARERVKELLAGKSGDEEKLLKMILGEDQP